MTETAAPINFEFEKRAKEAAQKADAARSPAARHEPKPPKPTWRDYTFSARTLQTLTFPPRREIVPGMVTEGLNLLVGRPKFGKSWAALEIAISCTTGEKCFGSLEAAQGPVLYAACEDNERRLQDRMAKLLGAGVHDWPDNLTLATQWRRLDKGGAEDVGEWLKDNPQAALVILDTLASVKPIKTQQGYQEDYSALEPIHTIIKQTTAAGLALHHQRKNEATDPLDTISGTLGLAGCVDTAIIMQATPQGKTLYVRGRDVEESEHAIEFDKVSCRWIIKGTAADVHRSNVRNEILMALNDQPTYLSPKQISQLTGIKVDNVSVRLGGMVAAGEVWRQEFGQYWHMKNHRRPTKPHKSKQR